MDRDNNLNQIDVDFEKINATLADPNLNEVFIRHVARAKRIFI